MDVIYWKFHLPDGLSCGWSIADHGKALRRGRELMDVVWDGNVPICKTAGRAIRGERYNHDIKVGARHTTGLSDFMHLTPEQECIVNTFGNVAGAKKYDSAKPMVDLLFDGCPAALLEVSAVLTYGFKKYGGKHGWKSLDDARKRYESAMLRHQLALASGELVDPESKLPHAAHIACNALFLLQFHMEGKYV